MCDINDMAMSYVIEALVLHSQVRNQAQASGFKDMSLPLCFVLGILGL